MIYETRVYRCLPGRLPALLKRFETVTLKLWDKHGIRQAGFFTTLVGFDSRHRIYNLVWDRFAQEIRVLDYIEGKARCWPTT